jgi:hypothetical protein
MEKRVMNSTESSQLSEKLDTSLTKEVNQYLHQEKYPTAQVDLSKGSGICSAQVT